MSKGQEPEMHVSDMQAPAWRKRLDKSLSVNGTQVQSKFYQVASISADGLPKNRTMVFRGFLSETQNFVSVTDIRSEKIQEWNGSLSNMFEICWYFTESREQYRISGDVYLVSLASVSGKLKLADTKYREHNSLAFLKEHWNKLSSDAKQQFYCSEPKAPFATELEKGVYLDNEKSNETAYSAIPVDEASKSDSIQTKETSSESHISNIEHSKSAENILDISENFCVVIFVPASVDYLNLQTKPQYRSISKQDESWFETRVNA